jgi:undecaprenyl-diphosphatase
MLEGFVSSLYYVDVQLFGLINLNPHFILLDDFVSLFTLAGTQIFWIIICAGLFIFGGEKGKKVAVLSLMALLLGYVLSESLKYIIARPRPFYDVKTIMVISEKGYSFPSGHATTSFAACTILGLEYGYLYLFLAFASGVALSRPYLGVHYPSDIIAGALLGIFCALLVYKMKSKIVSVMLKFKNKLMQIENYSI